jgi:hypothetical protein
MPARTFSPTPDGLRLLPGRGVRSAGEARSPRRMAIHAEARPGLSSPKVRPSARRSANVLAATQGHTWFYRLRVTTLCAGLRSDEAAA